MADNLIFKAWRRSSIFDLTKRVGARLSGQLHLTLNDSSFNNAVPGVAPFSLMAAADISGLKPGAIKHMAPPPFARDAETTKYVHVDFWEPDLPWRYTPDMPAGEVGKEILKPWLVLLVGRGDRLEVTGGIVNVKDKHVLIDHNLEESHRWAHVQEEAGKKRTISRILSPCKLEPQHEYVAVLVPAFNADGKSMWDAAGAHEGILPAFHYWRFWTGEEGDFLTLTRALRMFPAGDIGKAKMHYQRIIPPVTVEVGGAIMSMQLDGNKPEEPGVLQDIARMRDDLDTLNDEVPDSIGLPQYGRPWLPNPDDFPTGWPADLNDDVRFRSIAGLGLWMGIKGQEDLMTAAVQQAGALREAGQRIGNLALGLWASGRLWDRRLPTDKNERLRILGPLMGRMVATVGGIVLKRVTSDSSPLTPAVFSSAAQRLLRDRSPHTRHMKGAKGGINRHEALDEANQPERLPDRAPVGLPHFDTIVNEKKFQDMGLTTIEDLFGIDEAWIVEVLEELLALLRETTEDYRSRRDELIRDGREQDIPDLRNDTTENILIPKLIELLESRLPERNMPCEGGTIINSFDGVFPSGNLEYYGRVLEYDTMQDRFYEALWRILVRCMAELPCNVKMRHDPNHVTFCQDLLDGLQPPPRPEQTSVNLERLSDALYAALDPRQLNAPARIRLCSQLSGIDCTRLTRPEFPIGLDYATWSLLNKYHEEEWLLPGASRLEKNSVTALQTNPAFIDAYLVGLNTQFMSEMRWRDMAVARTCTPLRMFWGMVNYATQKRQADIEPLAEWVKATEQPIGALAHQTLQPDDVENKSGSRLVIAINSDLFRRYPKTLIYLAKPLPGQRDDLLADFLREPPVLDMPKGENETIWRRDRQYIGPTFVGNITPMLNFFIFDVIPSKLDQYWLVFDEPPAELRFRNDKLPPAILTNGATFAESTLDQPDRMAISGKELEKEARIHDH